MRRAVFLDRDGVLNRIRIENGKPCAPNSLNDFEIIEGVIESIKLLSEKSLELIVVTNQPYLSRGVISEKVLNSMHKRITRITGLKHFYICIHDDSDDCSCRKPRAGLLETASRDLGLDLTKSFLVGDRWKDIHAGQAAGCRCFFIDYGYTEKKPNPPFLTVKSLWEAAVTISELLNCEEPF